MSVWWSLGYALYFPDTEFPELAHEFSHPIDGHVAIFEAKGCLDGNNTNIFLRPPNADEFFIWSLCQNPGADPRHNAWSGIHTRLGATMIAERERIDGLVIWDMLCGTLRRPCPKLVAEPKRGRVLASGRRVPPPCIYLFPRSVPDARNNPEPAPWRIEERPFLHALAQGYGCRDTEIVAVHIGTEILHTDTFKRGLGKFPGVVARSSLDPRLISVSPPGWVRGGEFPFILTTGRVLEHYNCGTMTRRTGNARIVTEDVLAIHPADAAKKQITTGDLVRIFSARGEVRIHAKVSDEVKPGILYTTFHFPEHLVNVVTSSECDEDTMCPEYKVVAVDVERVSAPVERKSAEPEAVAVK